MVKAPGLPNITGSFWYVCHTTASIATNGAFSRDSYGGSEHGDSGGAPDRVHFNANRSNSLYGAANTVQPPAIQLIPQIRF